MMVLTCIARNYKKLVTLYNALFNNNSSTIENKYLKHVNERYNSTKFRQMNKSYSYLHEIQSYLVEENYYLMETELFKNPLCFDNVCKEIRQVVLESILQKPIDTADINIRELEKLQHEQIFNNFEIPQWAKNCNKLKTEILTYEKEEILCNCIMHLIGQLNEKTEIINNIVSDTENMRCKLVDEAKKSIEKDNKIKEITLEIRQLKNENEEASIQMIEFVKSCNTILNSTEERLKIQDVEIFERRNDMILLDEEVNEYKNIIFQLEHEMKFNEYHELKKKYDKLQNEYKGLKEVSEYLKTQCTDYVNLLHRSTAQSETLERMVVNMLSALKNSFLEIKQSRDQFNDYLKKQKDVLNELVVITKRFQKLQKEYLILKTQCSEQTKTIESNNHEKKLWIDKLNSANKRTRIRDAELVKSNQTIAQLTKELSDFKMKKNVVSSTKSSNESVQSCKKVITLNETMAIGGSKPVLKIDPDKENETFEIENDSVGNYPESNALQTEETSIIDTAKKDKEKSEENPNLIKEHKQNSNPSKTPLKLKAKPDKEIITTPSIVNNQIKGNLQCCSKVSHSEKPVKTNSNLLLRKPFR